MAEETVEANNTPLGSFKISSANLNNLLTVMAFIGICIMLFLIWVHTGEAKDIREEAKRSGQEIAKELKDSNKEIAQTLRESNRELAKVLGEFARATRVRNCLDEFPPHRRAENSDLCKRLSQ